MGHRLYDASFICVSRAAFTTTQIGNLEEVLTGFTEPDKDQIFRLTAARVYRVEV